MVDVAKRTQFGRTFGRWFMGNLPRKNLSHKSKLNVRLGSDDFRVGNL